MLGGEDEGQVVEPPDVALVIVAIEGAPVFHVLSTIVRQLAELVSLRPRGAVGMGVDHGDAVIHRRPVPRVVQLGKAVHLELELRLVGACQIGVGIVDGAAGRRRQVVGALGADVRSQRGREGDGASIGSRIEQGGTVVVVNSGTSSVSIGHAVGHRAGIGGSDRRAGDGKGVGSGHNIIVPVILQTNIAAVGGQVHKVDSRSGHGRSGLGCHGDGKHALAAGKEVPDLRPVHDVLIINLLFPYWAKIQIVMGVFRDRGRGDIVRDRACRLIQGEAVRLNGLAVVERHAESGGKLAETGTLDDAPVVHLGGYDHRLAALEGRLVDADVGERRIEISRVHLQGVGQQVAHVLTREEDAVDGALGRVGHLERSHLADFIGDNLCRLASYLRIVIFRIFAFILIGVEIFVILRMVEIQDLAAHSAHINGGKHHLASPRHSVVVGIIGQSRMVGVARLNHHAAVGSHPDGGIQA